MAKGRKKIYRKEYITRTISKDSVNRIIKTIKDNNEPTVPVAKLVPVFKTKQQEKRFAKASAKHRTSGAKLEW